MKYFTIIYLIMMPLLQFGQSKTPTYIEVSSSSGKMECDGHTLHYCLPRNLVIAELTITRTINTTGPYAQFADDFLNISEGVIFENSEFYEISAVNFMRVGKPDSSQFYSINLKNTDNPPLIQLNSDFTIISVNHFVPESNSNTILKTFQTIETEQNSYLYTDLGIKPFTSENKVTLYKTVQTDSTTSKVPYSQTRIDQKSVEQNAMAAAAFVRKIRKRKLKLLTGEFQESIAPDGIALERMVDEVKALEKSYVELFIGHVDKQSETVYLAFEPGDDTEAEQQVIGWFSVTNGISLQKPDLRVQKYEPISIKTKTVTSVPKTSIIMMDLSGKKPEPLKHGLYYRVPALVEISLQCGSRNLAKTRMEISQKGQIATLPLQYIDGTRYNIEFYPETGALKGIIENKQE